MNTLLSKLLRPRLINRLRGAVAWRLQFAAEELRLAFGVFRRFSRRLLMAAGAPIRKEYLGLCCERGSTASGLFSEFGAVLMALEHYEHWRSIYAGLRVDFADQGLYYEPASGENWWEYYFERIDIGGGANFVTVAVSDWQHDVFAYAIDRLTRERGFALINRYIRPQRQLREDVESYVRAHFQDAFVIGIHYRGTDKIDEAPRVPYGQVRAAVLDAIENAKPARYKLFLATDEQAFLDYMLAEFPGVLVYRRIFRSIDGNPIHRGNASGRESGEAAVIDCLLLSRTGLLIRTESNLSLCATFFNSGIPVMLLKSEP